MKNNNIQEAITKFRVLTNLKLGVPLLPDLNKMEDNKK